ncbi:MAG: 3-deoxy-manno-octulosonate cytidylyltransferase [Planctomycetota bacterium]
MPASCCVVIPARLASTRLPRKMLLEETGKSLIQHTYEAARTAERPRRVIVATDDREIRDRVNAFGGEAVMTSPDCVSGTDRVAEVARSMPEIEVFVNVQGDEPEIDPAAIDLVASLLDDNPQVGMSTVATPIRDAATLADPNCVKVVRASDGRALYFSRSPTPHVRDAPSPDEPVAGLHFLHLGLYAYRRDFLLRLAGLPASPLEEAERLEQLRVLEAGEAILVGEVAAATPGIDTAADYAAFVRRQA